MVLSLASVIMPAQELLPKSLKSVPPLRVIGLGPTVSAPDMKSVPLVLMVILVVVLPSEEEFSIQRTPLSMVTGPVKEFAAATLPSPLPVLVNPYGPPLVTTALMRRSG